MLLTEHEMLIPPAPEKVRILDHLSEHITAKIQDRGTPVRVAVTETDEKGFHCEVGVLSGMSDDQREQMDSIFSFIKRDYENESSFNAMLIT